jgi:hypothetical protein
MIAISAPRRFSAFLQEISPSALKFGQKNKTLFSLSTTPLLLAITQRAHIMSSSPPPYTPLPLSPSYWRNDDEDTTDDAVSSTDQLASFVNAASSASAADISPEYRDLHAQISKLSSIDDAPPVSPLSAASLENSPPPPRRTFASKYDA